MHAGQQPVQDAVAIDADDIGGVVSGPRGPEAGVWVIAETADFAVKFRKIVVTDDRGRYVLPDMPKAAYRVWVRGYGLIDSQPVNAAPGQRVALTAIAAPTPKAAAHYYPGDYWLSLIAVPAKTAFPMVLPPLPGAAPGAGPTDVANQAEWLYSLKRGCQGCHQMGNEATREIPKSLGVFDSSHAAWERRIKAGQVDMTNAVSRLGGLDRALTLFSDWTDRIAAGELPPTPPRPQGVERNVVISLWDFGTATSFVHDVVASDKRNPTVNANGPLYGADWSAGTLEIVDPVKFTKSAVKAPMTKEEDRSKLRNWSAQTMLAPSPYWGEEVVWTDPVNPSQPIIDSKGRVWFTSNTRADQLPFCKAGSANPFAKNFPLENPGKGLVVYDPKTGKATPIDLCFGGGHVIFGNDPDETLYFGSGLTTGGLNWFKVRVWDETHDAEKAQGWCPAVIDYNGDGKTGPYTRTNEPPDPELDRAISGGNGYGVGFNAIDGSVWIVGGVNGGMKAAVPGKVIRMVTGSNPPATCKTEVYEPPFNNPKAPVEGFLTQAVEVDSKGIAWVSLGGSTHLASFDRSKCKVTNGPTATGQHCAEGWTLYPVPSPNFKGTNIPADYFYFSWVDRENTLGLGKDVPVIDGTGSDSLIAFDPVTKKFITMRVPYPMGFYTRSMDGRIDDPNAGWKGRGLWAGNNNRVMWHTEGGKGTSDFVAKFQVRPDPLAK
jgi:hypothetical protein